VDPYIFVIFASEKFAFEGVISSISKLKNYITQDIQINPTDFHLTMHCLLCTLIARVVSFLQDAEVLTWDLNRRDDRAHKICKSF